MFVFNSVNSHSLMPPLQPYPISPRNTAEAVAKLLMDTSCHRVLATKDALTSLLDDLQLQLANSDSTLTLCFEEIPSLTEIYPKLGQEKPTDPFQPYPLGPRPSPEDTLIYFHSSGSTGFPRTVAQASETILHWSSRREYDFWSFDFCSVANSQL